MQAVNPSPTLTTPLATRCFFRPSVTLLECGLLTVKSVALVAVPPGVVTLILPVVAVEGTVAVIWVAEFTTNVAATLLKVTPVVVKLAPLTVPLKFVPVIVTDVPVGPKAGVNEVIVGAGAVNHREARGARALPREPCTRGSGRSSPPPERRPWPGSRLSSSG